MLNGTSPQSVPTPWSAAVPKAPAQREPECLKAALDYAARGFSVIPIGDDKRPLVPWKPYQARRASADEIREWWRLWPDANVGIVTGAVSGLIVIDVDGHAGWDAISNAGIDWHACPAASTGRGCHFYFRHPGGKLGNFAKGLPEVDGRADGGYVVAPPSMHANGRRYAWFDLASLSDRPLPKAPAAVLALFEKKAPQQAPAGAASETAVSHSAVAGGGAAVLQFAAPERRTPRYDEPPTDRYVAEAVARECEAVRVAPSGERNHTLNSASFSLGQLVGAGKLTAGQAEAALYDAAVASGLVADDGERQTRATIRGGLTAGAKQPRDLSHVGRRANVRERAIGAIGANDAIGSRYAENSSAAPMPFEPLDMSIAGGGRREAPVFPSAVLGEFWDDFVKHAAETAGAPIDYVASTLLCVGSALIGNSRRAAPWHGWSEPPHLWIALVGLPSTGKTPAQQQILEPLRSIEERMGLGYPELRDAWEKDKATAEVAYQRWREDVADAVKLSRPAPDRPASAIIPAEPVRPRVLVSDVTVEKAARIMAAQPRGLLMNRDELSGWLGMMNKYGGNGDRAFWLETYNGRRYVVDRVNLGDPLEVPFASAAILGSIQPGKLADSILADADDGMSARLLWSWPEPVPPRRPKPRLLRFDRTEEEALGALTSLQMVPPSTPNGQPSPITLPLTEPAIEMFCAWRARHAESERECADRLASHYGKHPGMVLRLALTIEHLWWCAEGGQEPPTVVSKEAIEAAITLIDGYFKPMARRAFGDAVTPVVERNATTLARWILAMGPKTINARELRTKERLPGLRDAGEVDAALGALVEAGWLRPMPTRAGENAGRRRKDFEVNPELLFQRDSKTIAPIAPIAPLAGGE